jgi:hypothetical protein
LVIVVASYAYERASDDTYAGMSIIAEEHKDLPIFEGLEPQRNDYVIVGDRWEEIHEFYKDQLTLNGWEVLFEESALNNENHEDDWGGFYSRWRKEGFKGELWLSAGYDKETKQTRVNFDHIENE